MTTNDFARLATYLRTKYAKNLRDRFAKSVDKPVELDAFNEYDEDVKVVVDEVKQTITVGAFTYTADEVLDFSLAGYRTRYFCTLTVLYRQRASEVEFLLR